MSDAQTENCPACGSLLDVSGAQIFAERTCPVCGTPINVRRNFGHYELVGVMGSGGQGVVYKAVDNNLNRLVALKLLRTEYSQDPEFVRQFEQEAKITAAINHPNVVRVFSFGSGEGHVYLAMELVDQGTLDDLMEKLGKVPEARALQIGIEVAQGLRAGNERGLVHRDVKPGNILFSQDGTAKIVDYGLAMFFEQEALASGEIWGTPYYLSPERLNKVAEDFRSDIYSLGATLFHAIAGRPPFEAEDASHVALKHLRAQAVSLQTFAPTISNSTSYVINRTLAKTPGERQQSYDEFIEQLQFAREEALARARGGAKRTTSRVVLDNAEANKATNYIALATLGVLLIAAVVGGYMLWKSTRKDDGITAPGAGAVRDVATFGPGWIEAQRHLMNGSPIAASESFRILVDKHPAGSPERAWALVLRGLSQMVAGQSAEAQSTLGALAGGGTQVSKFFHEEVLPKLQAPGAVQAAAARDFNPRNFQALGAFFFALKDYELGAADEARELLRQYRTSEPEPALAWLEDYKQLAAPLQDEFKLYSPAIDTWNLARSTPDREKALEALRSVLERLPRESKLRPHVQQLIGNGERVLEDERKLLAKSNLAYRAKVSASGFDESKGDSPDKAVDGDPKTRWSQKQEGEKWLAVDLGSAKSISRWVVKTAGFGGEKQDMNIREVKLQRSDDGSAWSDVDYARDNRQDVLDRVVNPFTARYVRLASTKGAVKSGDTGLRVFEFELGAAEDQPAAPYASAQSIAVRFSAASEFVGGSIGDPGILGSAKFESGRYTINGSGNEIGGVDEAYHFVWQPMKGDGEIVARLTSLEKKHPRTKAGLLLRSDLTKDGRSGFVGLATDGQGQFIAKKEPDQRAVMTDKKSVAAPRWLKLVREGSTVIGYESGDGQKWEEVGRDTVELHSITFVGMAVCSRIPGQTAKAEFEQVKVTAKAAEK